MGRNEKQLQSLEEHFVEEAQEFVAAIEVDPAPACPKCGGILKFTDLGARRLTNCTECKYRQTRKL